MAGIAWPDTTQHIFYTVPSVDGFNGIRETYWSLTEGWGFRNVSGSAGVSGQPVLAGPAPFVGADGPHLVYGGDDPVQGLFDLWWDGSQWTEATVIEPSDYGPGIAAGSSLAAYVTPDGKNHAIFPDTGSGLIYVTWESDQGNITPIFQNDLHSLAEFGPTSQFGPLVAYGDAEGNEWCFLPEAETGQPNLGNLWAVHIKEDVVTPAVNITESAGCPPVGRASGLTAYPIWHPVPIALRGTVSPISQHVFFCDGEQNIWEAVTVDGTDYTAVNLTEEAGAERAWYDAQGPVATPLAGFVTEARLQRKPPFGPPSWLPFPLFTQWVFYRGQDGELHYITSGWNGVSKGSLTSANSNLPAVPPRILDAYTSPDGTWHVDYEGAGELQEVFWCHGSEGGETLPGLSAPW